MLPLEEFVREALAERYAAPIVLAQDGVVRVLAGRPLALARERAASAGYEDVQERIVELELASLRWLAVPAKGLRLWRQHGLSGPDGELVTELEAGDPPFQIVTEHDGWQLARLADGATGWIAPADAPDELHPAAAPGEGLAELSASADAFAREVEALLGVPYVWGGTTGAGIDCSGLVQRAAWRAGRAWLPRHSTDLLKVGERIGISNVDRGDVLVLRRLPGSPAPASEEPLPPHGGPAVHPMHVAVAISSEEAVHASRDAWQVVREPIASLRERYRVLSVRRLAMPQHGRQQPTSSAARAGD